MLSTIDADGFPHTVPLGYFRLGRDIVMGVRDGTHKVANVERNPNVSILLEDGSTMADIRGSDVAVTPASFGNRAKHFSSRGRVLGRVACQSPNGPPHPTGAAYIRVTPAERCPGITGLQKGPCLAWPAPWVSPMSSRMPAHYDHS